MAITIRNTEVDYRFLEQGRRYYFKETVPAGTTLPVRIPQTDNPTIVHVVPQASATVQYTLSKDRDIEKGQALWLDWPKGDVAADTIDSAIGAITALRLVSSGTTFWEISI